MDGSFVLTARALPRASPPVPVTRNVWSLYFLLLVSSLKGRDSWVQDKTREENVFVPNELIN